MKQIQRGFTLIELVMVIVILGVLAAVALPKFVNLKGDAQVAALKGVVGAINSASAINYAGRSVTSGQGTATNGMMCSAAAAAILQGGVPEGYSVTSTVAMGTTLGVGKDCEVTQTDGSKTATAVIIAI